MTRYRIEYPALHTDRIEVLTLDAPDINTALIVADMNVERGPATIFEGDKRLATIERRGKAHPSYWVVS